ncbi:hypothetical protein N9917_04420 [Deltaproteobacteria bacterium]|nr:hypothetical protein [Deltaproteobacteria bacterium]
MAKAEHQPYNSTPVGGVCVKCDAVYSKAEGVWLGRGKQVPECPGKRPTQAENVAFYGWELPEEAYDYSWRGEPDAH